MGSVWGSIDRLLKKIPTLPSSVTTTLIVYQGISSVLNFVFLLHIFTEELPWVEWTTADSPVPEQLSVQDTPTVTNLNIASIALSSLTLLNAVVRTKSENSFRASKFVSILSFASFVILLISILLLYANFPKEFETINYFIPFRYMVTSVCLTGSSFLSFILIVAFGGNPQISDTSRGLISVLVVMSFLIFYGGLVFRSLEGWRYSDAVNFCFVTLTTVGYGNFTPKTIGGRLAMVAFGMLGLSSLATAIDLFRRLLVEDIGSKIKEKLASMEEAYQKGIESRIKEDNAFRKATQATREKIKLFGKRFGVLIALVSWWCAGAAVFMYLEGWEYFEAWYFTFVTLTTIGYGDFFPVTGGGKTFLIFYSLTGLGLFAAGLSTFSQETGNLDEHLMSFKNALTKNKIPTDLNKLKSLGAGVKGVMPFRKKKNLKSSSQDGSQIGTPTEEVRPSEDQIPMDEEKPPEYVNIFVIKNREKFFEEAKSIVQILSSMKEDMKPEELDPIITEFLKSKILIEETFHVNEEIEPSSP